MFFNKKIISAVAAVAMMLTSFGAFTVASATGDKPTVTVTRMESGFKTGTDAGVKFTVSDLAKNSGLISVEVWLPTNIKYYNISDEEAYEFTDSSEIIDFMYKGEKNTAFAKLQSKTATEQKTSADGKLKQYVLDLIAKPDNLIVNNTSFELHFVLEDKTWEDLPEGSFKINNVYLRYADENVSFDGLDKIDVINNAEVKAPASTVTPNIGGTDKNAVESFAGYADAANLGVYTNDDLATDKAVAFKTTVTGTTATGVVVWKVTSGGVSKYHKMSIGNRLAGGGDAAIGLAVEGLDDAAATAGVAFLQ